ncbi:hypothetical protein HQ535_15280, partial [bacterium]|nr:hypothetical protein [bacterium]
IEDHGRDAHDVVLHGSLGVFIDVNVDENPQTAMQHDVMSIPTMILYQDGVEKKRIVGARAKAAIISELGEYLS